MTKTFLLFLEKLFVFFPLLLLICV